MVFSKGELQALELLGFGKKRTNSFAAATRKAVGSATEDHPPPTEEGEFSQ